jgi:hypothetical protein
MALVIDRHFLAAAVYTLNEFFNSLLVPGAFHLLKGPEALTM